MKSNKVFLIGEIGINHNGSLKVAKELPQRLQVEKTTTTTK